MDVLIKAELGLDELVVIMPVGRVVVVEEKPGVRWGGMAERGC